jgi:hypothetical protein
MNTITNKDITTLDKFNKFKEQFIKENCFEPIYLGQFKTSELFTTYTETHSSTYPFIASFITDIGIVIVKNEDAIVNKLNHYAGKLQLSLSKEETTTLIDMLFSDISTNYTTDLFNLTDDKIDTLMSAKSGDRGREDQVKMNGDYLETMKWAFADGFLSDKSFIQLFPAYIGTYQEQPTEEYLAEFSEFPLVAYTVNADIKQYEHKLVIKANKKTIKNFLLNSDDITLKLKKLLPYDMEKEEYKHYLERLSGFIARRYRQLLHPSDFFIQVFQMQLYNSIVYRVSEFHIKE